MSKKVRFPDGYIGVVSDKVAAILEKRKDHKVLGEAPKAAKPEADKEKGKE